MTLHSTIKLAGAPADRLVEPLSAGGEPDLFTQLLSTAVLSPEMALADAFRPVAAMPELSAPDQDEALLSGNENEEKEDSPEEALALAGLFAIPLPLPVPGVVATPAAETLVSVSPGSRSSQPDVSSDAPVAASVSPAETRLADPRVVEVAVELEGLKCAAEDMPVNVKAGIRPMLDKVAVETAPASARVDMRGHEKETPSLETGTGKARQPVVVLLSQAPKPENLAALPLPPLDALQGPAPAALPDLRIGFSDIAPGQDIEIEQHLDLAKDSEWLDQLAKDIAQTSGKEGILRFRLNPETLGTLKVEVASSQAGMSVRMTADTETARAIVADAQPRLVSEARAQGVRIMETHVDLGTGSQHGSSDARHHQEGEAARRVLVRTAGRDAPPDENSERAGASGSDRYA
ncbi:flagellar hook-length control protein FliK [Allosphingosinicella flava]|nr:flagellar hook-length control protein FliK [Sphingosinicella flava]